MLSIGWVSVLLPPPGTPVKQPCACGCWAELASCGPNLRCELRTSKCSSNSLISCGFDWRNRQLERADRILRFCEILHSRTLRLHAKEESQKEEPSQSKVLSLTMNLPP
jgi:hypothetical protein